MSQLLFGIYGFDFSRPVTVADVELVPLHSYPTCRTLAQDQRRFVLTGYGRFDPDRNERSAVDWAERLAGGLTFCQQQHVVTTRLIDLSPGDSIEAMIASDRLPEVLNILSRRYTQGAIIESDAFAPNSRCNLLALFLNRVGQAQDDDPLVAALYRQIEIWRLSKPLIELEHFLAFSGLEILGRKFRGDSGNAAVPISGLLRAHGFDVSQQLAEDWCAARNEVFHRGRLVSKAKGSGNVVAVHDQLYSLTTLLADLCLKLLGFDDGHINWGRWKDRQPFC